MAYNACMTNNETLPAPRYIDTQSSLEELCSRLKSEPSIAVDTESDSLYSYHEKVCLIQFSTRTTDYLVDPLSGINVSPLGDIFADPGIEKIFHAAEYDVICLRRDYGFEFTNLFDTMQAARILGFSKLGLSSLLQEFFDVLVDKRFQKANWGKRPISPAMANYARLDTHYLISLRERLSSALEKANFTKIAQEDFLRIARSSGIPNDKPLYASIRGYHKLTPQQLAILNELCAYRDHVAQRADLPPFKILSSTILLEASKAVPANYEELSKLPGISEKLLRRNSKGLLEAVKKGESGTPIHLEHRNKPSDIYITRLEKLKKWRVQIARKNSVESDIILPREILEEIAKKNPSTESDLKSVMQDTPERFQQYHDSIMKVIQEKP